MISEEQKQQAIKEEEETEKWLNDNQDKWKREHWCYGKIILLTSDVPEFVKRNIEAFNETEDIDLD